MSGEYSLVKAGAKQGLIEEQGIMLEMLQSIKRAGADLIITYFAKEAAAELQKTGVRSKNKIAKLNRMIQRIPYCHCDGIKTIRSNLIVN